ncbi:MAG: translocation/assembly module TamB [Bacteroides sp.]|nr:translocation/assembly module TamB [Bacteroides sp.]
MYCILGVIALLYAGVIILLRVPAIQRDTASLVARELATVLGSDLSVGRIDVGLLNRIIIDDLLLYDRSGKEMLKVARLSAKFDILPLFEGRISISNVQLFGFNVCIEKETPSSPPNFQFVVDALASKDTLSQGNNLDLRINSLLIRRGRLSYDVHSEQETPGRFNTSHIRLQNIAASISLKALKNDSVNMAIKRMSAEELQSGFELKQLKMKLIGNNRQLRVDNFHLVLPKSVLEIEEAGMRYDSLPVLTGADGDLAYSLQMLPSRITLKDISPFLPSLSFFEEQLDVEMTLKGNRETMECSRFSVVNGNDLTLHGTASLSELTSSEGPFISGHLSRLYANHDGMAFLFHNLKGSQATVPPLLQRMGSILFHGNLTGQFNDFKAHGDVRTRQGSVSTDIQITANRGHDFWSYRGDVRTTDFQLGELLAADKIGKVSLGLHLHGHHYQQKQPHIFLKGEVPLLEYSDYTYQDITLDGEYRQGGFEGMLKLEDSNADISLNGSINTTSTPPTFNFMAAINHFRPNDLHLTSNHEDTEVSMKIKADFTGASIEEMNGEIKLDSLRYTSPEHDYFLENLNIAAVGEKQGEKRISIHSNFLRGTVEGEYSYRTLPHSIWGIMHRYLPALLPTKFHEEATTSNNFHFEMDIYDTDMLSTIFNLPVRIFAHSTVKGYFNDRLRRLRVEGHFPRLRYNDKFIESGMILLENPKDQFHAKLRFSNRKKEGAVSMAIDAMAQNDSIRTRLYWGNSSTATYSGELSAVAHFIRSTIEQSEKGTMKTGKQPESDQVKTVVDIHPTDIVLNDTLWQIHPSQIVVDSGKIHIHDFNFSHEKRHLRINGTVSKQQQDTLRLDLKEINIGYVFDIANLGVNFHGEATGPAYACNLLEAPVMSTDLFIRNLGLNDGLLGDANIHGEWHHEVKGIHLNARIKEGDVARSHVVGYIYPLKPTSALDLQIEADGTNLKFIHHFLGDITPYFGGRARGNVHLYGKFKALTMQGRVDSDASMKIEVLNTTYNLKDSILIEPEGLTFNNNRIYDTQGHEGRMNGTLRYRHFKDINYNFRFNFANMLLMDTKESPDYPFYGTIYGTGNATISGNAEEGMNADVAIATNRNSGFTYIKDYVSSAVNNQFIKFVDKTPRRVLQQDSLTLSEFEIAQKKSLEKESDGDIHLNLLVDVTPEANMKMIMDPIAGDYISGRGSGNIRTEFYNKGDVRMFGSYRINQGVYKFSLQEVIRKDFMIRDGSTLSFNGIPADANLDIQASYQVNSASLNDLMPNASSYVDQTNVKVECIMNLTGQLTSPDIKLGLELPNERDEVQALVRNYIPTDEQMNMQILYLLSIGKFYTPENVDVAQNSNMMSSVLSSTLSGQLNNMLSHIVNNNNWNIGTNFSTGEKGWTDVEFEGILSGQLLNNRLLINGNFGYRENPLSNTNFVGDFEAEWLVNRSGEIRLKAYNETNDRYYTRTNLTTQGIGVVFQKEFNKWSELFFWRKWWMKRAMKQKEEQEKQQAEASSSEKAQQ